MCDFMRLPPTDTKTHRLETMALCGPTLADIEAAKTAKGGWTRAQLAAWGVPWPPPKGWKNRLVEGR